jgi:hypothetical protein
VPEERDPEFRTEELPLAAFLCLEGHHFLRIDTVDGSHLKSVVFKETERLLDDVECYESGLATVEPVSYQKKYYWLRNKMNPNGKRTRARS